MSKPNPELKWLFSFFTWGALVAVAILAVIGGVTLDAIPMLVVIGFFGLILNGFVWNWGKADAAMSQQLQDEEKQKRDMLDSVLKGMSNEQLLALRHRLSDPEFEDKLDVMLGDDGELVNWR